MAVDLHLHSNASDGVDPPSRVIELAAQAGVTAVALTDHDTVGGVNEASRAAASIGVKVIPGVELSVDHMGRKLHMLVYFVDSDDGLLQGRLAGLREGRHSRNAQIVGRLNELGYEVTMDEVLRQASGSSVGRPHIADALIDKGYFRHRNEVFEDLLRDGGAAYVTRPRLTAREAIELARSANQVPVVAHPKTIQVPDGGYGRLFRELTDLGLGGIEAHHSMHEPELRAHLADLAHTLGIAATGGSDYHGAGKRDYSIGSGAGDLNVPDSAVEELEMQRT